MNIPAIYIAIWPRNHDWMAYEIRFITKGYGSHAAFVRQNGKIAENFYPHVRERDWKPGERAQVEVYKIPCTQAEVDRLESWLDLQIQHPPKYSVADLFRYAFNLPPAKGIGCFCSQWVLRGVRINLAPEHQPLVWLEYQDFAPPTQLRSSPALLHAD